MASLYDRIAELCLQKGISAGKMCADTGISRGLITDLKMGRKQSPTGETLRKIAEYFDVSIDYLLGNEKSLPEKSDKPSEEDIKIALFGGDGDVTDEMWEEAKSFAAYIKERERKKME